MFAYYAKVFLLSFVTGVAVGSLYDSIPGGVTLWASTAAVMIVCSLLISWRISVVLVCVGIGFCFGLWRIQQTFVPNGYAAQFGTSIDFEGVVVIDPPRVTSNQQITVRPDGYSQNIRGFLYQPIDAARGDRVWIRGVLEPPENFNDFDYIGYLQRHNVYASLKKPRIIVLKQNTSFSPLRLFGTARNKVIDAGENLYSERSAGLIIGMLIGQKGSLAKPVEDAFRTTGMMHVVAVSGYNMTIIAASCLVLAWYVGRRSANIMTIFVVLGFACIAGGSASVVRSAIMALLVVIAQLSGRLYTSMYGLVWAASLMVVHNPRIVVWDIGFQLSVAATLGVLYAYKLRRDESAAEPSLAFDAVRPTLGAVIATAPLVALHFKTFSVVALLANVMLLPFVPWIMLFGALSFAPFVGTGMADIASLLATGMIWAVEKFAAVPYSNINVSVSGRAVFITYVVLISIVLVSIFRRRIAAHSQKIGVVMTR